MTYINFTELSDLTLADLIGSKTKQLDALASSIAGEGFETFKNLVDDLQHNFLWTISEMASDIRKANDMLNDRLVASLQVAA